MTTIDAHAVTQSEEHDTSTGTRVVQAVAAHFTTTDHKRIGAHYIGWSLVFGLGVLLMGVLVGLERGSNSDLLKGAADQVRSLYGFGWSFLLVVPLVVGVATAAVPLQVGARSIAFPRLAATGFWLWAAGATLTIVGHVMNGGLGGGDAGGNKLFYTGHMVLLVGVLCGVISVLTTVITTRAAGMNMRRLPPFTWSVLVSGIGMLLAVPVLLGTMLYHYLNYRYGGQGMGGNKAMAEWVGFGYSQPMTLVYSVPAFGMFAEMAATASKQRLAMRGVMFIGLGLLGVSAFGAVTQTQPVLSEGVFDATFSTFTEQAVPFAFVVLLPLLGAAVVLGTVGLALRRKPTLSAPLLFAVFGMLMVFVGMLATVLVSIGDIGLGDSRAPEAAAVYVLGGALLAMLAAVFYWGPKLWGTVVPTAPSAPLALLGVAGVVLASLPHIIAGWADGFAETASIIGAIGYVALALTVLGVCSLLFLSWRKGERAADDPWGGQTLEWLTPSPAPADNFSHVRTVTSPEPLFDLQPQLQGNAE